MKIKEILSEKWSAKYKRSINCSNPKGFSQKAHCAGRKKNEDVPQPGESSGKAKQFVPGAKIQTKEMTLDQILSSVKDIPYVNNVVDDWDAKDYSWGVTKKVIEYARYLQKNPQSIANLPPLVVIDGRLDDGAHRLSAVNLLQKRMDPKNPLWKQVKLKIKFGTSADVSTEQGVAEGIDPDVYDDLDARTIVRAAKSVMRDIRGRDTDEGYVHLTSGRGLDLYIGAGVADGEISINIGSGGGLATSGTDQGAVTAIIKAVYDTAVRKYGQPDTPGSLTIDDDAGHGVWQHIAQKLGLTYDSMNENFADGKKPGRKGLSRRVGIPKKATLGQLEKIAKGSTGERRRMAQWQLNMRRGKAKKNNK